MRPSFVLKFSMVTRILLSGLFVLCLIVQISCSASSKPSVHNRPLPIANRDKLKVRPSKQILTRKDLENLALTYKIIRNEKPSVIDILELNEGCRSAPFKEELTLGQFDSSTQIGPPCKGGIILLPIS